MLNKDLENPNVMPQYCNDCRHCWHRDGGENFWMCEKAATVTTDYVSGKKKIYNINTLCKNVRTSPTCDNYAEWTEKEKKERTFWTCIALCIVIILIIGTVLCFKYC